MNKFNEYEFLFHVDCVSEFNNQLFDGVFTTANITSKKKCIPIGEAGDTFYGYFLEKNKESYFALDSYVKQLPFRITKSTETDYKGDVFHAIEDVTEITIPAEKRMSFRDLIDLVPAFKHNRPDHWTLYKILSITAWCDRINARISTDAGFGKDSVANILSALVNSTANMYGATFAKLEFVLKNRLIVLNELGNLKKDDKIQMQEFLLAVGAFFNEYNKRTRKTNSTQEQYDISELSLLIFYNLPDYYTSKGQEYFDQMFQRAVVNRVMPFVFRGQLTTAFESNINSKEMVEFGKETYKNVIATLHYFKENNLTDVKWKVKPSDFPFSDDLKRYERTFSTILKYVAEYSETQEEFDKLSKELYNCYKTYDDMINKEKLLMR